ncbi:ribonuclease H-like domain-containing protein [Rhodocollybia butyracea]|uniref:Ribonuclease H-like domain-containing protein n=1 Tax=Rhodocollybia butyracea TaxID=206335 RepID=A0A9P5UBY9_9AGAR|nr:ribonuclease H-like domain-containing protein [Rhodocollybia butyracea]
MQDAIEGPLVWIDCEMRLEIAVLITNGNLETVDEGIEYVIKTEKHVLDQMDEWCTNQHGNSGLTNSCLNSPHTHKYVSQAVLAYVKRWVPNPRTAVLAGNSVHADRSFLVNEMPELLDWLHYRCELAQRWYKDLLRSHRSGFAFYALQETQSCFSELKWYRDNFFVKPKTPPPSDSSDQPPTAP